MSGPSNPQEIAERCAAIMWPEDRAAQNLGIRLLEVGAGTARVSMTVRQDMANGHGVCHGGFIFALADCCFDYACNSFNRPAVAADVNISFLAPARVGDVLTSHGRARHQGKRSGIYDIEVTNQDDKTIALFRGRSTHIDGRLFDDGST